MSEESHFQEESASTSERFVLTFQDKRWASQLYLCVLVKGVHPNGERRYCYFGIFADSLVQFLAQYVDGTPFNPKQLKGIVLARSTGEPSAMIQNFMSNKFSFSDDMAILEISRKR